MAKILLIEDDKIFAQNTRDWLGISNHLVELAECGAQAKDLLSVYTYDLLIVDYQLPDTSGPEIIREFRSGGGTTPVLMLTARQSITDKESGFSAGADDYLDKAAHPKELSMRVNAMLRRPVSYVSPIHKFGTIEVNANTGTVTREGEVIHLLPKEYALLLFLITHSERVFTAEELLDKVWPSETDSTPHTVRSCINRLRNRLDKPGQPSIVATVRGLGYGIGNF